MDNIKEDIRIEEFYPSNKRKIKQFVKYHWDLYKNDQFFIPQLNMELSGSKILGQVGLLYKDHPFHKKADVVYFMAYRGTKIIGRISACINYKYNEIHNEKIGHFGFFEVEDNYETAKLLLDKAVDWIQEKGMLKVHGPSNFSANESWGLLIDPYDDYPFMGTTYNKPYFRDFIEKYGFVKVKDLLGQLMPLYKNPNTDKRLERLKGIVEKIKTRYGINVRPINLKNFEEELRIVHSIYNSAWAENWGAVPMDFEEFHHTAVNLKLIADPNIFLIAYKDGKPVAFIGTVPDVNEMIKRKRSLFGNGDIVRSIRLLFKRKKVKRVRLFLFGILKEFRKIGLDSLLYYESFLNAYKHGKYEECEISWLLEDNILVIRAGESMNAKHSRTWRLYEKSFEIEDSNNETLNSKD